MSSECRTHHLPNRPRGRHKAKHDEQAAGRPPRTAQNIIAFIFQWHAHCSDRACRRALECRGGETPLCFDNFWPGVSERDRVGVRAILTALSQRVAWPDVVAACERAWDRWDALAAKGLVTAEPMAATWAPPQPAAALEIVRAPPTVRIRSL